MPDLYGAIDLGGTKLRAVIADLGGNIVGEVILNLTFAGVIQADAAGETIRVPGTTRVIGTATSGDGVYNVDLTI